MTRTGAWIVIAYSLASMLVYGVVILLVISAL